MAGQKVGAATETVNGLTTLNGRSLPQQQWTIVQVD
jgi:hypothetical protein